MIEILPGETFSEAWDRAWYANELGDGAYGHSVRIARIRRGKYVRIPPEWRGKVANRNQIRKRQSKRRKRREETAQERRAATVDEFLEDV